MSTRKNARGRGRGNGLDGGVVSQENPLVRFTVLNKEYTQLGGTMFIGSEGNIEAQQWLKSIERIFIGLDITDAQKHQLASWQLQEAAQDQWESVIANTPEDDITWTQFS